MAIAAKPSQPRIATSTPSSRPKLRVIEGGKPEILAAAQTKQRTLGKFSRVIAAVLFLFTSLLVCLGLQTQMASNAFDITSTQQEIGRLNQDVQDDQAALDSLRASLPQKASKLGMVSQSHSVTIDMSKNAPKGK
jgi:cell division protein FtsL